MDVEFTLHPGAAPGTLEAELDREFVSGRGRTTTLRSRYPLAFTSDESSAFLVGRRDDEALACLAGRHFDWQTPERRWRGVMIGLVYTTPAARGTGLGSRMLRTALETFTRQGDEFAVLWSRIEGFYEACGFRRADCGTFGRWTREDGATGAPPGEPLQDVSRPALQALEDLRRSQSRCTLLRPLSGWETCPIPADEVRLLRVGPAMSPHAYALFGVAAGTRIVYELIGEAAQCATLWPALAEGAQEVLVNERLGSPTHRWLAANAPVAWHPQDLALWAPLNAQACNVDFGAWYLPWLDRL
ncbi:MAG: GNAT family N-acetyltransferase [Gammaproteobacteria bacterium]|nr:GNAT family N-acetyltransferase [Gammaproteobacteria bacterium]